MKRTYRDSSVLIQAVQGVDGDKTASLLEDPEREFAAATFLKLELLRRPTPVRVAGKPSESRSKS